MTSWILCEFIWTPFLPYLMISVCATATAARHGIVQLKSSNVMQCTHEVIHIRMFFPRHIVLPKVCSHAGSSGTVADSVLCHHLFLWKCVFDETKSCLEIPSGVQLSPFSSRLFVQFVNCALKCHFIPFDISTFYYYYDFIAISFRFVLSTQFWEIESLLCALFLLNLSISALPMSSAQTHVTASIG